jgi:hypothetical protein
MNGMKNRKFPNETVKCSFNSVVDRDKALPRLEDDHTISHIQWESEGKSIFITFKGKKLAATWLARNNPPPGTTHELTGRPKVILAERYQWKMPNSKGIRGVLSWARQEILSDTEKSENRTYIISMTSGRREGRTMYLSTFHHAHFPEDKKLQPKIVSFDPPQDQPTRDNAAKRRADRRAHLQKK